MSSLLIRNATQIVSPRPGVLRGPGLNDLSIRNDLSILIRDGHIETIGPDQELAATHKGAELDAAGKAVIPGLVDAHTHLLFGGNRADEFALRTAGASYEEIAAQGGGIARTVAATRKSTKSELVRQGVERLDRAMAHGITTLEAKTGYGLNVESEMTMLDAMTELDKVHAVDVVPTFLGAHGVPKDMETDAYLNLVRSMIPEAAKHARFCDIFCEQGYFTPEQSVSLLELACDHGMLPRLHADQFNEIGCLEAAIELGAVSVDHLEATSERGAKLIGQSDTAAVMLPGVSLFLDISFAPARSLIDNNCIPVIATDFNPGSNMCLNLPLMLSLACMKMRMSVGEALCSATQNAAHALRLDKVGCIEPGWQADLLVLDTEDYRDMFYFYGENHVHTVIKRGVAHARH